MNMPIGLIVDIMLVILLGVAIYGAVLLNRNLGVIRRGQDELNSLVSQLNEATGRAQTSIQELKRAGLDIEETLHTEIGRARALADELSLITEAGGNLADRLEKGLTRRTRAAGPIGVVGGLDDRLANDPFGDDGIAGDGQMSSNPVSSATEEAIFAALKEAR